jgi:hypothetical protein
VKGGRVGEERLPGLIVYGGRGGFLILRANLNSVILRRFHHAANFYVSIIEAREMKTARFVPLLVALFVTSCSAPAASPEIPTTESPAQPGAIPSETLLPTATEDPFPNPALRITGEEEVVFDWTSDRCAQFHIPDLPTRAFRNAEGQAVMIISHTDARRAVGPDLNTLAFPCEVINESGGEADPAQFDDQEWIAAPYTLDGATIYALVHNEYQGHIHAGQCPTGEYFDCWYNSLTLAVSTDGGQTFADAAAPPGHLVAALPLPYEAGNLPYGVFSPGNIVRHSDGYFYSFVQTKSKLGAQWACLMRTDDLADPRAWRFWDGAAFEGVFVNPYADEFSGAAAHTCDPIAQDDIGGTMVESLTFNTYLNRYVLVGLSADHLDGREVWGAYYSFSFDLIHWTRRKLLVEMPLPWTVEQHTITNYLYPTLLDPASPSLSFETSGKTAYLYYTRHNFGQGSLDRDLLRVPVEFFGE